MSPESRRQLSSTIRALRAMLIERVDAHMESVFQLKLSLEHATGLRPQQRADRRRIEAWCQTEAQTLKEAGKSAPALARRALVKEAAYTLLHRLICLRLLEAQGQRGIALVTGGWGSKAMRSFGELHVAPEIQQSSADDGYGFLLQLTFDDLARDLPGLYGRRLSDRVPVPPEALRMVVEALDDPALAPCWTDDMTLGWVYQYFNDPEREALDAKLNDRQKLASHEIASKTQMFTERYMVSWLLQNSVGPMWLAMCQRNGWTPEVMAGEPSVMARLEARRVDWRRRREAGEVELTALMPLESDLERRWAWYVPQPIPEAAVSSAPASIRDLKLIDPACGSGHFLVVALELLFHLHLEEARHRGESEAARWQPEAIVSHILSHTLHGVDLDPRAVQIAATALWLKAKTLAPKAQPQSMQLVATRFGLGRLPHDDPARVSLRAAFDAVGVPESLTDTVLDGLADADHLGSLLRVDKTLAEGVHAWESGESGEQLSLEREVAQAQRRSLDAALDAFLQQHTASDDLGLRLRGEQVAAGARFTRMMQEGQYDLVVGNPPYQGTSKMADAKYVQKTYPRGKADLYAAFLERGLQLARPGGVSAMLTMRNWMFIKQYAELRQWLLETYDLRAVLDLSSGAFTEINPAQVVVSVVISVFWRAEHNESIALRVFDDETVTQQGETQRKRAATLCHYGRCLFRTDELSVVPEWPLAYWWNDECVSMYKRKLLGDEAPVKLGVQTSNSNRFNRLPIEVRKTFGCDLNSRTELWVPYIKGGAGAVWCEPLRFLLKWSGFGLELKVQKEFQYGSYARHLQSEERFFQLGVACSPIGDTFSARAHRYESIIDNMGVSVFSDKVAHFVTLLNSSKARYILESLNPTVHFTSGDINRLPLFPIANADDIFATIEAAFDIHEAHREPSVEFKQPGPSPWRHAQDWAQIAVDRPEGAPLPEYIQQLDPEPATDHLSYAVGVALGRFGPQGEGVLDPATDDLSHALPEAILFVDGTLGASQLRDHAGRPLDSVGHDACELLRQTWAARKTEVDTKAKTLRAWLRADYFGLHRAMYENRPIHWPISSAKKTFVAWITIHRWRPDTLKTLLADHLLPAKGRIEGLIEDLQSARRGDGPEARQAEIRYAKLSKALDELDQLIADVTECDTKGPPPTDNACTPRAADAEYVPDLDDGVMVNSSALWPLLQPQWKDPKKWWKELANAKGKKDYDWSHLAMRYFPERVDAKCQQDPSLGVAHGCFWRYHPAVAWRWELRLQDEIAPDFRIDEADSDAHRAAYLSAHPEEAAATVQKEALRRIKKAQDSHKKADKGEDIERLPVPNEMQVIDGDLWTRAPETMREAAAAASKKIGGTFTLSASS